MTIVLVPPVTAAGADEPVDTWPTLVGIDCLNDRFNPVREDGTKDPEGDPEPGSPEWIARDGERLQCDNQRDYDRRTQPFAHTTSARYGEDWYRQPFLHDDVRFRFDYFPTGTGPGGVPAMEVYRPCSDGDCAGLPQELQRFEPPYPVVIIHHGFIAQMTHHRFNAQAFAEAGYLAISVNGTHPLTGAPNVQRNVNAGLVLDWLASDASGEIGDQADLDRVATVGHSQGAAAALSYQGDPRVHTIIAWDGGDGIADNNMSQPIMYQRTDGAFSAPQNSARTDYPAGRDRGLETYATHKERGLDVYHVTFRGDEPHRLERQRGREPCRQSARRAIDQLLQPRMAGSPSDGKTGVRSRRQRRYVGGPKRGGGARIPSGSGAGRFRSPYGVEVR
ncbi:MAG: hypothetical protein ACRDLB_00920 [Actinomycetota bacterium]